MAIKKIERVKKTIFSPEAASNAKILCDKASLHFRNGYYKRDKESLYRAMDLYMEAVNVYPRIIEPYICLAYIAFTFEDTDNAREMLFHAQRIEPHSEDVTVLLNEIEKSEKHKKEPKQIKTKQTVPEQKEKLSFQPLNISFNKKISDKFNAKSSSNTPITTNIDSRIIQPGSISNKKR